MRSLTVVAGILMLFTGLWCFANPGASLLSVAFIVGLSMIITGAIEVTVYLSKSRTMLSPEQIFAGGAMSIILGLFVICDQLQVDAVIPVFFGLWVIFIGMLRLMSAIQLRKKEHPLWQRSAVISFAILIIGIWIFLNVNIKMVVMLMLVGISCLVQGLNLVIFGIDMKGMKKKRNFKEMFTDEAEKEGVIDQ